MSFYEKKYIVTGHHGDSYSLTAKQLYERVLKDSKLLYSFLLDRLLLSIKNNWHDENGNVYLIFTRKEVQDRLNLSDKTVTKAFKQLSMLI